MRLHGAAWGPLVLWLALAAAQDRGGKGDAWAEARRLFANDPAAAAERAVLALGRDPAPDPVQQRLAFDLGLVLLERGEDTQALALQEALHGRVQADWSALDLIQTLARLGHTERADGLCAERLERSPLSPDLWNARALLWLGAGQPDRAAPYLGAALRTGARGSRLTLARLDLVQGRREAARAGFRTQLGEPSGGDWALAGWALTLLPHRSNGAPRREALRNPLE